MTFLSKLLIGGLCLTASGVVTAVQLANYIGTGQSPKIQVILSGNGPPKWDPFSIDYQQKGNMPCNSMDKDSWSAWDIKDTPTGNYYGTITLKCDGKTALWVDYKGGSGGYYLEGVHFSSNGSGSYQLTVDKIHCGSSDNGPFPSAPLAIPAEYKGTDKRITLSVKGTQIQTDRGNPFLLKGVVRPSLEWNPKGQFLSTKDLDTMHSWGINVIRIDMNQNFWFVSQPASVPGSYKQIINALIYYAIERDMVVILDLHWTEDGHQNPMANKNSIKFWKEVAYDYRQFGTVIFELFNEPNSINKNVWLKGDATYAGYQELFNAVRSTGAKNICIINGLDWGYNVSFINSTFGVKGKNIVYGSHPYNDKGSNNYQGPGGDFDKNFKGIIKNYPIIFTEFGVNQDSYFPDKYKAIYDNMLRYINANKIHYSGFAWWVDNKTPNSFPDLIKDWAGTPLNGGINIQKDLKLFPPTKLDFD